MEEKKFCKHCINRNKEGFCKIMNMYVPRKNTLYFKESYSKDCEDFKRRAK